MKVNLEHTNRTILTLVPEMGSEELMIAALVRLFVEGGDLSITPERHHNVRFVQRALGAQDVPTLENITDYCSCLD